MLSNAAFTQMSQMLPEMLGKRPLREVIFELRFTPAKPTAGDLLPGILYPALKSDYSEVIALPMASIPRGIRDKNPDLTYQPSHSLSGGPHSVQVGDRSVRLNTTDYPGWTNFKRRAESLIDALKRTEFVKQIERFSFKYINLIEAPISEKQLPLLNIRVELTGRTPSEKGFHLRDEHDEGKYTVIIQIAPNTIAKNLLTNNEISGLMIDVDTIRVVGNEFWENHQSMLEEGHMVAKQKFYSLLTQPCLERLDPKY